MATAQGNRRLLAVEDEESPMDMDGTVAGSNLDEEVAVAVDSAKAGASRSERTIVIQGGLRIELGVLLVLCSSAITLASSGFRKQLAMHVGGAKRSFALSVSLRVESCRCRCWTPQRREATRGHFDLIISNPCR